MYSACLVAKDGDRNVFWGKWKSLAVPDESNGLDFNVTFEKNNSLHIEIFGGAQTQKIIGEYKIIDDSFFVRDVSDTPIQSCNYSDTGIYTFTKRADSLFFKTIRDNCERRKLTLEIGLIKREQKR